MVLITLVPRSSNIQPQLGRPHASVGQGYKPGKQEARRQMQTEHYYPVTIDAKTESAPLSTRE